MTPRPVLLGGLLLGGCVEAAPDALPATTLPSYTGSTTSSSTTAPATGEFFPEWVGFELDAAMEPDGTLVGHTLDGVAYPPRVVISFASDAWAGGRSGGRICHVWTEFHPEPAPDLATEDGAELRAGWIGSLVLLGQDCAGQVTSEIWGEDGSRLYGHYGGARFGVGLGPMTPALLDGWSAEELAALGSSLLAEYVEAADPPVLEGRTTATLYAWDAATGHVVVDGSGDLVPIDVPAEGPLPPAYVRSQVQRWEPVSPD